MRALAISVRNAIFMAAGLRAFAIGFISIYLGLEAARRGIGPFWIGVIIAAGLFGNTISTLLVSFLAQRMKRSLLLMLLSFLMGLGGIFLMFPFPLWMVAAIACFTLINGMGKDRSGLRALDLSTLPDAVKEKERTSAFAAYNVILDLGGALGAAVAVLPDQVSPWAHLSPSFLGYAGYSLVLFLSGLIYFLHSPKTQHAISGSPGSSPPPSHVSKKKVWGLAWLFLLDSLGGGFLTGTLISYWFVTRFHPPSSQIALLFFVARLLNLTSNYAAVAISKKIGMVRTMVFTHFPSSLFLLAAAWSPTFGMAVLFFLIRESLVQMDVPTRESYLMAVIHPGDRDFAAGLTGTARNLGWAIMPVFAGSGMASISAAFAFIAGSILKMTYDVLLYFLFRKIKPPEEQENLLQKPDPS